MTAADYLKRSAAVAVFLAACAPGGTGGGTQQYGPNVPSAWSLRNSAVPVHASRGAVVSGHPLATQVGLEILQKGGNAVDAAVGVGFALAVTLPAAGNIGGGGFMIIRTADGKAQALDYRERAPAGATPDMYVGPDGEITEKSITGHLAAGVPGSVAGLQEAHARYGRLSWKEILEPAVRLAREGVVIDEPRHRSLAGAAARLRQFEASRKQFLPGGQVPDVGTVFKQPELARTLEAIGDSGASVFYTGYIAKLIVDEMKRGGGIISLRDLAEYEPVWRAPVETTYRGYKLYSMPPSSSGGVTLTEILNILEGFDPLPEYMSAPHVHLLAEAMRRAFVDRNRYLGDPAFVAMPLERLTSKSYAAELAAGIDPEHATPTPTGSLSLSEGVNTTHYSVVDSAGNAVSVTTTINSGYGSAVTVAGAGFLLNNEMDDFTAAPGKPNQYGLIQSEANAIQPGKRMLSAMTPTIVLDPEGRLFMVLGSPGGPRIITTVMQVISDVVDYHMSLAEAVSAPRVHHQGLPDIITYEPAALDSAVIRRLGEMGHELSERGFTGDVSAIERDDGGWVAVADPRRGGGAAGW